MLGLERSILSPRSSLRRRSRLFLESFIVKERQSRCLIDYLRANNCCISGIHTAVATYLQWHTADRLKSDLTCLSLSSYSITRGELRENKYSMIINVQEHM